MGLRYFKRVQIIPGLRVNLSRSGVSASVGRRGAWYTFGNGKRRATIGLPGTGVSYTSVQGAPSTGAKAGLPSAAGSRFGKVLLRTFLVLAVLMAVFVAVPHLLGWTQ